MPFGQKQNCGGFLIPAELCVPCALPQVLATGLCDSRQLVSRALCVSSLKQTVSMKTCPGD